MLLITEDAVMRCDHAGSGKVNGFAPAQSWVTIERRRVLVEPDPEQRPFDNGCMMKPPDFLPCSRTLKVTAGYSTYIKIDDRAVCLSTVVGLTLANPQTKYRVYDPAQQLVGADG
jgi:hypothetical protein